MAKATPSSTAFGITSLVLGIIGFLTGGIGLGLLFGVLAIIFGGISLRRSAAKGMSIAGIILGSIATLASLIFLMVFISLPALQASQRDTARKNDLGALSSAVTNYQSNHKGGLPTNDEFADGSFLSTYGVSNIAETVATVGEPTTSVVVFTSGVSCPEDGATAGARHYNFQVVLESGSRYCVGQ